MRLSLTYEGSKEYERIFNIDLIEGGNMELFRSMNYIEIDSLFRSNNTINIQEETYVVKSVEKTVKDKEFFVDITIKNVNDIVSHGSTGTSGYNFTYLTNR